MKKLTIAILMLFSSFSLASAELGVNVGVSANTGIFTAEAEETMGTTGKRGSDRAVGVFGYTSVFIEKTLGQYLFVGVDYSTEDLDSESVETNKKCSDVGSESASCNQVVKVSFSDMTTMYAAVNVTENFFVKAGRVEVDLITNETLGSGGTYGNTSLDGNMVGFGYNKDVTNGMFLRAEASMIDFDDIKLDADSGETRFIKANGIGGASAKISVGKTF